MAFMNGALAKDARMDSRVQQGGWFIVELGHWSGYSEWPLAGIIDQLMFR